MVPPDDVDRAWVHERYVGELLRGEFRDDTRQRFTASWAGCAIGNASTASFLAGTELPLLLHSPTIADVAALDTTALHVAAIVRRLRHGASG